MAPQIEAIRSDGDGHLSNNVRPKCREGSKMSDTTTTYCKNCGHAKEHHNLDVHLHPHDDAKAREHAARGEGACHDNSYGDHQCICVEFQSWT